MSCMNESPCPSWAEPIALYLDGGLGPAEELAVHGHLRACPACADHLVALAPVVEALKALPAERVCRDLWPAIAAELRHDGQGWTARVVAFRPRRAQAAVAAAALIALMGGFAVIGGNALVAKAPSADREAFWEQHHAMSSEEGPAGMGNAEVKAIEAGFTLPSR